MQDWNWKTWSLIFVVAIGITFEAFKRLPADGIKLDVENLKLANATAKPYQVKYNRVNDGRQAPNVLPMHKAPKVGGSAVSRETLEKFLAANTTHKGEFGHVGKGAEGKDAKVKGKKKKKGDDDEYEIIIDPATGKRYRRKKKKKPATEEVAKVEEVKEEPKKEEPPADEDDFENLMNEAIATGNLPPTEDKADTPYATLEDWMKRLLAFPDPAETRRFIEHYKNSLVSADIFYKIVAMMIEDSRPQMKELGVLCAGLTPSVVSFTVLADVVKAERSGSSVRSYAESFMNRYADLGNLHVLERILKAPQSSFVAVLAAKKLDASANLYLSPSKHKPSKNPTTQSNLHSNAGYFQRFVKILTALQSNPDTQVNEQARVTLANINQLISTTPPPTTLPPGGNPSNPPPPTTASTQP